MISYTYSLHKMVNEKRIANVGDGGDDLLWREQVICSSVCVCVCTTVQKYCNVKCCIRLWSSARVLLSVPNWKISYLSLSISSTVSIYLAFHSFSSVFRVTFSRLLSHVLYHFGTKHTTNNSMKKPAKTQQQQKLTLNSLMILQLILNSITLFISASTNSYHHHHHPPQKHIFDSDFLLILPCLNRFLHLLSFLDHLCVCVRVFVLCQSSQMMEIWTIKAQWHRDLPSVGHFTLHLQLRTPYPVRLVWAGLVCECVCVGTVAMCDGRCCMLFVPETFQWKNSWNLLFAFGIG